MAIPLRQSTASQEIILGYFVDSTDGNTEETGLTINNTDIKLWKAGAVVLANKNLGGATHISNALYYTTLDDTDTDTRGPLVIFVHVAGALAVRLECIVLAANVYDSLIAGTDALQVHANEITNGLITAAAVATGAIDSDAIADGAIDAAVFAAGAINAAAIADGAIDAATFAAGAINAAAIADGAIDAATFAAGAITAAAVATNAIDADALAADAVAEIADGVWDEARAGHVGVGSFGEGVASVQGNVTGSVGSVGGAVGSVTGAVGSVAAGGITAASIATGAIDADALAADAVAEVADGVWDEARAGHVGAGSFGEGVASVQGAVTGAVGSVTGNVGGNVVGSVGSVAGNVVGSVGDVTVACGNAIADHALRRTFANARASADGDAVSFRSLLGAVAKLVNRIYVSGGNLLITQEDDLTTLGTQAITTDAAADPISDLNTV